MIVSLYLPILALIYLALSGYVIAGRFKHKVSLGDGGVDDMTKRVRAHANFMEYVPLAALLLLVLDFTPASNWVLHTLFIVLIIARLAHVPGILCGKPLNILRLVGMIGTLGVILVTAIACLYQYFFPPTVMMF